MLHDLHGLLNAIRWRPRHAEAPSPPFERGDQRWFVRVAFALLAALVAASAYVLMGADDADACSPADAAMTSGLGLDCPLPPTDFDRAMWTFTRPSPTFNLPPEHREGVPPARTPPIHQWGASQLTAPRSCTPSVTYVYGVLITTVVCH